MEKLHLAYLQQEQSVIRLHFPRYDSSKSLSVDPSMCTLLIRPGEILESIARNLFTMNEHAIANVYIDFELPA